MERTFTKHTGGTDALKMVSYKANASKHEKKLLKNQELSCSQLLKNLKQTNLGLLKINDISTFLLF